MILLDRLWRLLLYPDNTDEGEMMSQSVGQDRHITLDAMRGFAVMGILAMNIIAFAMPEWAYVTPLAYGGESLADRIAWFLSAVFVDGKMRGLFSLLFGASLMLITERAEAKGASAARTHYARMVWLALFEARLSMGADRKCQ